MRRSEVQWTAAGWGSVALVATGLRVLGQRLVAIGHRMFVRRVAPRQAEPEELQVPTASGTPQPAPIAETYAPLVIREWNRVHFIALDDIEWIQADNNHVVVHTNSRTYKGRERMSDVEARLNGREFVRVHRSAIVHRTKIREVQPLTRGDQAVILRSGRVVRVSRARRQALEHALGTEL